MRGESGRGPATRFVLKPEAFQRHVDRFNRDDEELYVQHIPTPRRGSSSRRISHCSSALIGTWSGLLLPLVDVPQADQEHADGFVITEFLRPWDGRASTTRSTVPRTILLRRPLAP